MANLTHAELVTPERVLFSGEAEAVIMRVDGGDTTFLANHSDFIGAVDVCVVRIQAAARAGGSPAEGVAPGGAGETPGASGAPGESTSLGEVRAAVHGGFVKVADNKVTIVAGVAELADEIDVGRAQRALEAAEGDEAAPATDGTATAADEVTADADTASAAARARVRLEAAEAPGADLSPV
jgi:F-type H+-transporting ATPase subunit epsilon